MTLGRLMELYQAEQQGKQIMVREYHCYIINTYENIKEIKLSECELSLFTTDDDSYTFFIKDEEDKYGYKLV